jgi:hypothetical protein
MKQLLLAFALLAACSDGLVDDTTTNPITVPPSTSTSVSDASTTTTPPLECPAAPYDLEFFPQGVGEGEVDTESLDLDVWTSVAGSRTTFVPRNDGTVAIALIRGTLPPVDWPGDKGEISIDGTRAAVGPHPDGTWVVGWFEEPGERCDQYTMVFYPPWAPPDVEEVLQGMNRVGG